MLHDTLSRLVRAARPPRGLLLVALATLTACPKPETSEPKPPADPTATLLRTAGEAFENQRRGDQPPLPACQEAGKLILAGRYPDARAILEPALSTSPDNGRARMLLALCHQKEKRYAQARVEWERLLALGPAFKDADAAFYYYGWCLYYLGEPTHAATAFQTFLRFRADDHDSMFGLGLCAMEAGDLDEAETRFQASLHALETRLQRNPAEQRKLASDFAKVYAGLGDIAIARDQPENARDLYEKCVSIYPPAYEAWFKLYRVHTRLGDDERAAEALKNHDHWKRALGRSAD